MTRVGKADIVSNQINDSVQLLHGQSILAIAFMLRWRIKDRFVEGL